MAPEVISAWIALVGVVVATIFSLFVTAWSNRRQRENELIISALNHLVGGSQERTAGIAALSILSGRMPTGPPKKTSTFSPWRGRMTRRHWTRYSHAVGQLLYSQLLYLLLHAGNRGQAHEIANLIAMADWLLSDNSFGFDDARQRQHLRGAMDSYATNSPPMTKSKEDPDKLLEPDLRSVHYLKNKISRVWGKQLDKHQDDRSWFDAPGGPS